MLANLYLHWFDKVFHRPDGPAQWAKAKLVRYADDFVIFTRSQLAAERVLRLAREGKVAAADGTELAIQAETVCVHGDNPAAVQLARKIRESLVQAGIEVAPMGAFL